MRTVKEKNLSLHNWNVGGPQAVVLLSSELSQSHARPERTSRIMQINGKKEERLERRGQFVLARASALAASPLSSLAYSRSTVTQKKKKRLLVVFQAGS